MALGEDPDDSPALQMAEGGTDAERLAPPAIHKDDLPQIPERQKDIRLHVLGHEPADAKRTSALNEDGVDSGRVVRNHDQRPRPGAARQTPTPDDLEPKWQGSADMGGV